MKNNISILINVTSKCNLRCKYCYHQNEGYEDNILELSKIEKLLQVSFPFYDEVKMIWHGGEPTIPGVEYYKECFSLIEEYSSRYHTAVRHSLQTNATLIDDEWVALIKKYDIHMGLSFDGKKNDFTRGAFSTQKVIGASKMLEDNGIPFGYICVANGINVLSILEDYELFNSKGYSYKINPYITEETIYGEELFVDEAMYIDRMAELFVHWINDKNCKIMLDPLTGYIIELLIGPRLVCYRSSCLNSWIGIKTDGTITPCSRYFPAQYEYINVEEINDLREIYKTEGYKNIITGAIARRNKCRSECDLYRYCNGGCNNCAIIDDGLENNNGKTCRIYKGVMHFIIEYLDDNKITSENYCSKIPNKWLVDYLDKYKELPILKNVSYNI